LRSVTVGDKQFDFGESEIQIFGDKRDILVRVVEREKGTSAAEAIKVKLRQTFADRIPADEKEWLRRQEKVGPKIGSEMKKTAMVAVFVSLLLILIYVAWRFEFKFGVAAVISLFHDTLVTLGILSIMGMEFSMSVLAALLTIVGYSINDTIVVCDRIRENKKILRREKFADMVNTSINQTLSRTILTAGTVWLVSWVLFFKGGEVIHGFAFALLVGVFFGTYSSIFVVSAIVVDWVNHQEKKRLEKIMRKA
jgi:preprotein translocase SecF subunit